MTSNITVISGRESQYETVRDVVRYDGTQFPTGLAGFIVDQCTVICHECHDPDTDDSDSPIFGVSEWDYPGYTCEDCGRWLDVRLLVYESGPGSEVYEEYNNE
jgi:hypothetical protein